MVLSSRTSPARWLLEATCHSTHSDGPAWQEQLQLLCFIGHFDKARDVWVVRIGVLDIKALATLNTLFEAAARCRTRVSFQPVTAPPSWSGPVFTGEGDLARLAASAADQGRRLGHLPAA
ncbi:hypothetical protein ABZ930_36865 [Streptomyces sp. NPDC046716]|uniref:hypothetical protein n=1 Tax=Streptomyces sp. NPDC046716 TaxID=3157093 RepID=UPI0034034919